MVGRLQLAADREPLIGATPLQALAALKTDAPSVPEPRPMAPASEVTPSPTSEGSIRSDRQKWRLGYMGEFHKVAQEAAEGRGEAVSEEALDARALRLNEAASDGPWLSTSAAGCCPMVALRTSPRAIALYH